MVSHPCGILVGNGVKIYYCTDMNNSMSNNTEPLSEFRKRTVDFIRRLKLEKQPIILTQQGKHAAVLMDVSEFERLTNRMKMLEDLLEAKQQVVQGKTLALDVARERIEKHF